MEQLSLINYNNKKSNTNVEQSLLSSDQNIMQDLDGETKGRRRSNVMAAITPVPLPEDNTMGCNGSCEVQLLQNFEHIQPSYYTQRKLLNSTQTNIHNTGSSQPKSILNGLQDNQQLQLSNQQQYSLQNTNNLQSQQYQINVTKQKNKFLETRSKSIQRNQDSRQVVAAGYPQSGQLVPQISGATPLTGALAISTNKSNSGHQSKLKISNKSSNAQAP